VSASARVLDDVRRARRPMRFLGASGQLGYGIPTPAFEAGLARRPDMIGCDMGSIDIGPSYLGKGEMATAPAATRRDLRKALLGARRLDIPLVIGSAGSAGAAPHLEATLAIVRDIARAEGLSFRMGVLRADIPRTVLKDAVRTGKIVGLDGMPALNERDVDEAAHIVGQMGTGAFRRALAADIDVLIAGRACDTAIFAALPTILDFPTGPSVHMAKIIECASLCCLPGGRDSILATLDDNGFELESMAPQRKATPVSVAAHSLYEQGDPYAVHEPDGALDLSAAQYVAIDDRRTRVSGARWHEATDPMVKLEGAAFVGERAILLAGAADPRFIRGHRAILEGAAGIVRELVCEDQTEDYTLRFHVYGVDGVRMAVPADEPPPREVFVMGEVIAPTCERAAEVMRTTKQYLLHYGYAGRLSTAGNLAFPFTPPEVSTGPAYRFSVFHLMRVADPDALFPLEVERVG
jgi:acyclic terpene utilization AtuA family protein